MDTWRSADRVQERRLWSALTAVGVVLILTLLSSILLTAAGTGSGAEPSVWFYLQQVVLLALSVSGTATAVRHGRALRRDGSKHDPLPECDKAKI